MLRKFSLYVQAAFYIAGGINHFWHKSFYLHIMPDHYSNPDALVRLSGVAEILGGAGLLVPAARRFSAGGIIAMLIVFMDVHQYMARHPERFPEVPAAVLWGRIPLQFLLIAWAYQFTRKSANGSPSLIDE